MVTVTSVKSFTDQELVRHLTITAAVAGALAMAEGLLGREQLNSVEDADQVFARSFAKLQQVESLTNEVLRRVQSGKRL